MVTRQHVLTPQQVVAQVVDPELPMLTVEDLGVVRSVEVSAEGTVRVTITPTYAGCPALEVIRDDLRARLGAAGYRDVEIRTVLAPPWRTDWISDDGRRKLAEHGIAPPGRRGAVPVTLGSSPAAVACPRCGCAATGELSRFGPTPCTELRRCPACLEPFEHVKET